MPGAKTVDAGTIKSDIRIDLAKLRTDFARAKSLFDTNARGYRTAIGTVTKTINQMGKMNATVTKSMISDLGKMRTFYMKNQNMTEKGNKKVVQSIDQIVAATKNLKDAEERTSKSRKQGFMSSIAVMAKLYIQYRLIRLALQKISRELRQALKVTQDYEQALANTQSVAQATERELRALDAAARRAGETTRFTATQAAASLYYMASAGYDAGQSIQALDGILAMAQATGQGLDRTGEVIAATLAQFGLAAHQATRVANTFTAAITNSQATMDKLATSLHQAGPVAAGVGKTLEETAGVLQLLYNSGIQAHRAGRSLRNSLGELANESSRTSRRLAEMGIAFKDVDVTTNDLADVFGVLNDAGLTTGQTMHAFGKVIGPQIQVLIRAGRQEIEKYTDAITDTNKAFLAAHIQNDTLQGDLYRSKSAWEALSISLVNNFMPTFRSVVQLFFTSIRQLNIWVKRLSDAHTSADDLVLVVRRLNDQFDEYKRLTELVTDSVEDLTEAELDLYNVRRRNIALDTQKALLEIADTYKDVIKEMEKRKKLAEISDDLVSRHHKREQLYRLTALIAEKGVTEERKALYEELARDIEALDKKIGANQIEALEIASRKQRSALRDSIAYTGELTFSSFEDLTNHLTNIGEHGLDNYASAMVDIADNMSRGIVHSSALTANELNTMFSGMDEAISEAVTLSAKWYSEKVLTDEHLIGVHQTLIDMIKQEAEELDKRSALRPQISPEEYEEIATLQQQLDLRSKATDGIKSWTDARIDASVATLKGSENLDMINQGFAIHAERIKENTKLTIDQVEAQHQANMEIIDSANTLGAKSKALLEGIASQQMTNELLIIEQFELQQLAVIERERLDLIGETKSAELEAIEKRLAGYDRLIKINEEYSSALKQQKIRTEENAIAEAYETARTTEEFEVAYQRRLTLIEGHRKDDLNSLKAWRTEQESVVKASIEEQEKEQEKTYNERLRMLRDARQSELDEADRRRVELIGIAEAEKKEALSQLELEEAETAEQIARNKVVKSSIRLAYINALSQARNDNRDERLRVNGIYDDLEKQAQTDHNDDMLALEGEQSTQLGKIKTAYQSERLALLAYYSSLEQGAEKEKIKLHLDEMQRQAELLAQLSDKIQIHKLYIDALKEQEQAAERAHIAEMKTLGMFEDALVRHNDMLKENYNKRISDIEQAYDAEKYELDKLLASNLLTQEQYNSKLSKLNANRGEAETAAHSYYLAEKGKASKEFTEEEVQRNRRLVRSHDSIVDALDRQRSALEQLRDQTREDAIAEKMSIGQIAEARELFYALERRLKQKQRNEAIIDFNEQAIKYKEQYEDQLITYKEYTGLYKAAFAEHEEELLAIDAIFKARSLDKEKEFAEAKLREIKRVAEEIVDFTVQALGYIDTLRQQYFERQMDRLEALHTKTMDDLDAEMQAELEKKGLLEDTEIESLEKQLQKAIESADEERINELRNTIERTKIQQDYADEKERIEGEFQRKKAEIEYAADMAQWRNTGLQIVAQTALAIIKSWPNPFAIAAASALGGLQLAAHAGAQPEPPELPEFYSGGIIKGSQEGTHIIAGDRGLTEAIFNPDQMANLLMAIASGRDNGSGGAQELKLIIMDRNEREIASMVVNDYINNGIVTIDPTRGLKKQGSVSKWRR